jgi:O-antigen ligase
MRAVVRALLLAYVFAVPWEYSLDIGPPLGNVARIAALVLLAAAIPAILLAGRLRTPGPLQWLVLGLFLWGCISVFWTIDQGATLERLRGLAQVMAPVWLMWEIADTPADLRDLLRAYVAGSWVLAVLSIASVSSADAATQIRFVAEGQDPNDVARFLDLGLPMSALLLDAESAWPWKLLAVGYLPIGLGGVLLSASRGGVVAALVALAGCGVLLQRRHMRAVFAGALSLPAIAAAVFFLVSHETLARLATIPEQLERGDLNRRLNIWAAGWQAFVHAPFFGAGAGTFIRAARLAPEDTAHNTALTLGVEGGIVALMLAAAILAVCAGAVLATRGPLRIALGTAFLVWLVTSVVATVETNRTTWLLMCMMAVAGRLAVESPAPLEECFPTATGDLLPVPAGEAA